MMTLHLINGEKNKITTKYLLNISRKARNNLTESSQFILRNTDELRIIIRRAKILFVCIYIIPPAQNKQRQNKSDCFAVRLRGSFRTELFRRQIVKTSSVSSELT